MENNVQFIGVQVSDLGLSIDNNLHGISASFVCDTNRILHGYFYIFNNRSKPEIHTHTHTLAADEINEMAEHTSQLLCL